jgi:hypothetical protein
MAYSPLIYPSTPDTTNKSRVQRVVLGPCTDGLRDLLRFYVPPSTFSHVISVNRLNLPRLTAHQRDLILPRTGHYRGCYDDMDISLLYILLRNVTNIPPQNNGWGFELDPSDRSISATIERIHLIHNRSLNHSSMFMPNKEFYSIWSTIRSTMADLDKFLGNGERYQRAVDFIRVEFIYPEMLKCMSKLHNHSFKSLEYF